jgi:hypothetical protein
MAFFGSGRWTPAAMSEASEVATEPKLTVCTVAVDQSGAVRLRMLTEPSGSVSPEE